MSRAFWHIRKIGFSNEIVTFQDLCANKERPQSVAFCQSVSCVGDAYNKQVPLYKVKKIGNAVRARAAKDEPYECIKCESSLFYSNDYVLVEEEEKK